MFVSLILQPMFSSWLKRVGRECLLFILELEKAIRLDLYK